MIQRKQTIFLLIAIILTVVCLCQPLGTFTAESTLGAKQNMYNLWIVTLNNGYDNSIWALFAMLLLTCPIALIAIFMFHNRIAQARFCMFNMLLILGWHIVYAVFAINLQDVYGKFSLSYASVLPLVSFILYFIARKAILADEALVRAADRIR